MWSEHAHLQSLAFTKDTNMLSILLYAECSHDFRHDFAEIVVFTDLKSHCLTAGLLRDVDGHL